MWQAGGRNAPRWWVKLVDSIKLSGCFPNFVTQWKFIFKHLGQTLCPPAQNVDVKTSLGDAQVTVRWSFSRKKVDSWPGTTREGDGVDGQGLVVIVDKD